jgi:hypothetical protein
MTMEENKELTADKKRKRQVLILGCGLLIQYSLDRFGYSLSLSNGSILLLTFLVITGMTIMASRFIGKKNAIWTAVIASVFESAYGQMLLIESTKVQEPWPPVYILSIPIFAGLFYLYAIFINTLVKQKYQDSKPEGPEEE